MFILQITCKYNTIYKCFCIYDIITYLHFMLYTILPSLLCLSEKMYVALCFSLKIGRSAMVCFHLLHSGYNAEMMFHLVYGYSTDI